MRRLLTSAAVCAGMAFPAVAADSVATMFSEGKTSGQIRFFYIDRKYTGFDGAKHRNGSSLAGHLAFETASWNGVSLGASYYSENRIFRGLEYGSETEGRVEPSLFNKDYQSYSILGDAHVGVDLSPTLGSKTRLKLGYQQLNTPLASGDDARTLTNTFEAYVMTNQDVENLTLLLAHVNAFAAGSFSNVYSGGILAATSGYSPLGKDDQGKYTNMGRYAVGKDTAGVSAAAAIYKSKYVSLQVWDYYAWDILNAVYGQVDLKAPVGDVTPFLSAQVIKENNIGGDFLKEIGGDGKIDSLFWAAKAGVKYHGLTLYGAYSEVGANDANDAAYANAIITPWGGMPAFTQGMVTRHQFLAGTKALKGAASYSFKEHGIDLNAVGYYTTFDMDDYSGYGDKHTANEPGFDVIYYPLAERSLQLRFRGNFPHAFFENATKQVNWNEYRFIANYNF